MSDTRYLFHCRVIVKAYLETAFRMTPFAGSLLSERIGMNPRVKMEVYAWKRVSTPKRILCQRERKRDRKSISYLWLPILNNHFYTQPRNPPPAPTTTILQHLSIISLLPQPAPSFSIPLKRQSHVKNPRGGFRNRMLLMVNPYD